MSNAESCTDDVFILMNTSMATSAGVSTGNARKGNYFPYRRLKRCHQPFRGPALFYRIGCGVAPFADLPQAYFGVKQPHRYEASIQLLFGFICPKRIATAFAYPSADAVCQRHIFGVGTFERGKIGPIFIKVVECLPKRG